MKLVHPCCLLCNCFHLTAIVSASPLQEQRNTIHYVEYCLTECIDCVNIGARQMCSLMVCVASLFDFFSFSKSAGTVVYKMVCLCLLILCCVG